MKRSAFQRWMAQVGFAAALLLVLVPTVGRVVHAGMDASVHAALEAGGHAHHGAGAAAGHEGRAAHARGPQDGRPDRDGGDPRPAIGDPDCDYCPLLASMATPAPVAFALAAAPASQPPQARLGDARPRRRHPCGLGSRGPPCQGR